MSDGRALRGERLAALAAGLELPCFVYDPVIVAENIQAVRATFPGYHYPVKCNPHPEVVRTAMAAGAALDLCSEGDIAVASVLKGLDAGTSYTGAGLTPELMRRVAAAGCRVNLNSLDEVGLWTKEAPRRVCGIRLEVREAADSYGAKFGLGPSEVARAREMLTRSGAALNGVHVHDGHRGRTPEQAARVLADALGPLEAIVVRDLDYVSLGGGWPHAYEGEQAWQLGEVAREIAAQVEAPLRGKGFRGRLLVEPGEFVTASAGAWIAAVASVKRSAADSRIVILDTPTPVPCADFPYPLQLLRREGGARDYSLVRETATVRCAVHGSTNTGRDRIRAEVLLPEPFPGDAVVIGDAGAYVHSLISPFNERRPPVQVLLPTLP
jgi:diaminopimelate decarboxylase